MSTEPVVKRSLVSATVAADEDGTIRVTCCCDCATTTVVQVVPPPVHRPVEFAYTCDGCGTSHWMALGSRDDFGGA